MSAPTQPTPTTLVTEALRRFLNGGDPDADEITRGIDYGLEKVKRDIMGIGKQWKPLIKTYFPMTKVGVSHYDNPADFEANVSVGLMTGDHTGLLTAVNSTTDVVLAAAEDALQREAEGKYLLITSGTGKDQAQIIDDYTVSTKQAILASAFSTSPIVGDGYMIVNSVIDLTDIKDVSRYDQYQYPGAPGTPKRYVNIPNDTVGQLALHPVPNAVFGLRRRYFVDLMKLDLSSNLYSTLLRRWANVFEQGVFVWKLREDDDRYEEENQIYQQMLKNILVTDLYGYTAPDQEG
jgi:hypothetical protein